MTPCTGLNEWLPCPHSGVLVLPMNIAPAPRIRAASRSSLAGIKSAKIGDPYVVRSPAVAHKSLTAIGMPCSQPRGSASSAASASFINSPRSRNDTIAFTAGFTASIRFKYAAITSDGATCRAAIIRDRSEADI